MATLAQVADVLFFSDCDHNYDTDKDGVSRCQYCGQPEPVCAHARVDCYNEESEEYVGWHCLDCGEPVDPPAAVEYIDELPL